MADEIYLILHIRAQTEYTEGRYFSQAQDHSDIIGFTESLADAERYLEQYYKRLEMPYGDTIWIDPKEEDDDAPEGADTPYNPWAYEIRRVNRIEIPSDPV